jgi:hypothetical protein
MLGQSTSLQILFPARYTIEISKLRQQLEEAHFAWKTEWERQQFDFAIENIRFAHDPNWKRMFFSLQSARDGGHWFWGVTHSLLVFDALST